MALPGYQTEMQRIERDIADIDAADALAAPVDPPRVTEYLYRLYQRASIAGDLERLSAVELALDQAIPLLGNPGDLFC